MYSFDDIKMQGCYWKQTYGKSGVYFQFSTISCHLVHVFLSQYIERLMPKVQRKSINQLIQKLIKKQNNLKGKHSHALSHSRSTF